MSDTIDTIDNYDSTELDNFESPEEPSFALVLGQTIVTTFITVATAATTMLVVGAVSASATKWNEARLAKKKEQLEKKLADLDAADNTDTENSNN